ncbi:MAG TPA: hypothetical protein VKA24_06885 [Gaiellaceae bacterium]|nr:hypothetical protein [Gaiellaceae bacterium]
MPAGRPEPAAPPAARQRAARRDIDFEELLGGRLLAWVGGLAVLLGIVFFVAMAVFDLRGATAATSTTLVFPPTDHRFLQLRGVGVPLPVAVRSLTRRGGLHLISSSRTSRSSSVSERPTSAWTSV